MATTKKWKRVAAAQDGFLTVNAAKKATDLYNTRKKRVNKNKKKSWNKHSDVQDVEQFLDDFRLQERAVGGLLSEKTDDSLFFVDLGKQEKTPQKERQPPPVTGKRRKGKVSRPLRIDLILKNDSLVPPSKDVLSHQQPNAKKLRRTAERIENQAAKGKVSQRQKRLLNIRPVSLTTKKAVTETGKNPERGFFDLWGGEIATETEDQGDQWYLQQTCKKRISRPERMNEKPSILPAVEVIAPGGSYNPDFFDHQALLKEAHEVEVKKEKVLTRLKKQLAVDRASKATEEDRFQEQVEGLVVDDEEEEEAEDEESPPVGAVSQAEKKTEKQRKKEKALKFKAQRRKMAQQLAGRRQQLFQLRSLKASVKQREQRTKERRAQRKANEEAALSQPRRLGRQKFHPQDMEVQLSDELAGSLRRLKPEGSVLKDRFKSLQKRNLIEPRERAKFVRKHKVKYQEKRAFREIT